MLIEKKSVISRIQQKFYEPTIEWDVYREGRWIGTVLASSTTERLGPRDEDALRIACEKFAAAATSLKVKPRA